MKERLRHIADLAVLAGAFAVLWGILAGSFMQGVSAFGVLMALLIIFTW